MKIEELRDEFLNGYCIKRESWNYPIKYIPGDSMTMEDYFAEDWVSLKAINKKKELIDEIIDLLVRLRDMD